MAESFQDIARRHLGVNSNPAEAWLWLENPQTDAQRAVVDHMRKHEWRYAERSTEVHHYPGLFEWRWVRCEVEELKVGDRFRSFEADGKPVLGIDGHTEFIVKTPPSRVMDQLGNWVLHIDPAEKAPDSPENA